MKKIILFLLCAPCMVLGLDKEFFNEYFASDLGFSGNKIGVFIGVVYT